MTTKKKPQKTVVKHIGSGTYDGAELLPFNGRIGAMDAYSLPSLQGDLRVKHRPMVALSSKAVVPYYQK